MKLNRQSNIYTVVYIIIMVVVVGAALAYTSMALSERQGENERADKMRQILASIHVAPADGEKPAEVFDRYIAEQKVLDASGQVVDGENAFDIDVAQQSKLPSDKRLLPLFVADVDGATKYIIPMSGTGLWGPYGDISASMLTAPPSTELISLTKARLPDWEPKSTSLSSATVLTVNMSSRTVCSSLFRWSSPVCALQAMKTMSTAFQAALSRARA